MHFYCSGDYYTNNKTFHHVIGPVFVTSNYDETNKLNNEI